MALNAEENEVESFSFDWFTVKRNFMKTSFAKKLAQALVCLFATLVAACVSTDGNAKKNVDFISTPDEATVFINGENRGLTPLRLRLSNDSSYSVRFSKPGFFDEDFLVEPTANARGNAELADRVEVALQEATGTSAVSEISSRQPPADFTEFRLREKEIGELFQQGKISTEERTALLEKLRADYDKASNTGTVISPAE